MTSPPSPLSRLEAQRRADAIHAFREEIDRLERDRVLNLSDEQKAALRRHHDDLLAQYGASFDIDRTTGEKQLSLGMRVASLLGAVALSASVYFIFYQIWGRLGTGAQVVILVAAPLVALAGTFAIRPKDPSGYFTNLAAILTLVTFVIDLSMLGQIFSITPTDGALVVWGGLAFVLAYALDLRSMLAAGIAMTLAFFGSRIDSWDGLAVNAWAERPETLFLPAIALFALPLVARHERRPSFPATYRALGATALLAAIFFLGVWGAGSYIRASRETIEHSYQNVGLLMAAVAIVIGVRARWRETVNVGGAFFLIFMFMRFVDWFWDLMPRWAFFLVLGLAAVLILIALKRARGLLSFDTAEARA